MSGLSKFGWSWALGIWMLIQVPNGAVKGYAFFRPILGGARPGRIVEEGVAAEMVQQEGQRAQYFLYVLSPNKIEVKDTAALWVEGRRVSYRFQQVSLPVIQPSSMIPGQQDTLLQSKSVYAYALVLDGLKIRPKAVDGGASLIEWQYKKKGKRYRCSMSAWKALSPLALP